MEFTEQPSRRTVLRRLMATAALVAGARPALGFAPSTAAKPDIVIFIADDLSWTDSGVNGSPDARTPHIDRLAKEGTRFTRMFCASPTCTPSRSALLTGDYPMHNGAHANHSFIKDGISTLPDYFRKLGYRVAIAGKTHIGPRADFPFEYVTGSTTSPPSGEDGPSSSLNVAAVDRLFATRDPKVPLALFVASYQPHVPWMANRGFDPAKLTLPANFVDTPETRQARARYLSDVSDFDRELGELRASIARHGRTNDTLFILTGDHGAQWPFAKWNLYDPGIHVPMTVVWPGHVSAGRTSDALLTNVDILPTLMEAAGAPAPPGIDGRSFLPVLTSGKGKIHDVIFAAHTGDGRYNHSPMRAIRSDRWKLIVNLAPQQLYINAMTQADGEDKDFWPSWVAKAKTDARAAALVNRFQHRPPVELYDLQADPDETTNLAGDPRYRTTQDDLRKQLDRWRLQQGEKLTYVPMPEDARTGGMIYGAWK